MEKQKQGFTKIEKDIKEANANIRKARGRIIIHAVEILVLVLLLAVVVELLYSLQSFDSYELRGSVDRSNSDAAQFAEYGDYIIEYSNDGISCVTHTREPIWNQSYEMTNPKLDICGDYLTIYDEGGTKLYILGKKGLEKHIETTVPIRTAKVAKQGTVAVLMREETVAQVKLFDTKGTELANGRFYGEKGGFPIDIALSHDGKKLAVNMVDISKGSVSTTLSFYNFGSVGQSEIDNNVGTYTYKGLLVPEIDYVSNDCLVAMGTGRLLIFNGGQRPELTRDITIKEEILSFFHNDKYIGITYNNAEEEQLRHIKLMDLRGNVVMEHDTGINYSKIELLSNNEVCVTGATECELFTVRGIKKFSYSFEEPIYKIIAGTGGQDYTFIFKDTTEEVKLK